MEPVNWPKDMPYVTTKNWNYAEEIRSEYQEQFHASEFVDVQRIGNTKNLKAVLRTDFAAGYWLDEVTGHIVRKSKTDRHVVTKAPQTLFPFYSDSEYSYFIDTAEAGNEMRFVRKTSKIENANVKFTPLLIQSRLGIFVEVLKPIKATEELVGYVEGLEEENEMAGFTADNARFKYSRVLLWDKIVEEERERVKSVHYNLSSVVEIKTIEDEKHPCKGELGVFAKVNITKGSYIGEYTGIVITSDYRKENIDNRFLADFTLASPAGVDASDCGNETRFINDHKGISSQNVKLKCISIMQEMCLFLQVLEDIHPGEEVLTSYGDKYWAAVAKI